MNLTLNDVYNESAARFSEVFDYITLLFQLLVAPFIIFAIITRSKKMGLYRWYLVNCIIWNTLVQICVSIAAPAILSPYPIIVFNSILESFVHKESWYFLLEYFFLLAYNMLAGYFISAIYRLVHLINLSKMMDLISRRATFIVWLVLVQIMGVTWAYLYLEKNRNYVFSQENYIKLSNEMPFFNSEFKERAFIGFTFNTSLATSFIILSIVLVLVLIGLIFATFAPAIFLRIAKQKYHKNTYSLQLKLYKAVVIQLWVSLIFGLFPFLVLLFIIWQKIPHTSVAMQLIIAFVSLHGPIDLFVMGYFIPSNRKFFVKIIKKIKRNIMRNQVHMETHMVSVVNQNQFIRRISIV